MCNCDLHCVNKKALEVVVVMTMIRMVRMITITIDEVVEIVLGDVEEVPMPDPTEIEMIIGVVQIKLSSKNYFFLMPIFIKPHLMEQNLLPFG